MTTETTETAETQVEPLIYTKLGNLPIKDLTYKHYREDVPGAIVFVEEYLLGGESVKRSVHVLPVVGICREGNFFNEAAGEAGKIPGGQ